MAKKKDGEECTRRKRERWRVEVVVLLILGEHGVCVRLALGGVG